MPAEPRPLPIAMRMIGANLIEIKVDHEVELTELEVEHAHAQINKTAGGKPVALLVEKTNHYSYTFEAMRVAFNNPLIFAIAYFIASEAQRPAVNALISVSERAFKYPIQVFSSRSEALEWLAQLGADVRSAQRI